MAATDLRRCNRCSFVLPTLLGFGVPKQNFSRVCFYSLLDPCCVNLGVTENKGLVKQSLRPGKMHKTSLRWMVKQSSTFFSRFKTSEHVAFLW